MYPIRTPSRSDKYMLFVIYQRFRILPNAHCKKQNISKTETKRLKRRKIEMTTGEKAYYCGKPNLLMMRTGLWHLGCRSAEAVTVGDIARTARRQRTGL